MNAGNATLAKSTLEGLFQLGMREICVCPGSRNAPWIQEIQKITNDASAEKLRAYFFFEERSASFFALGRIRATGRPVGVATTSGTAAAELLPATMEAHYSGLPLVLMTADRPRRFRGTGAPQTAEQVGLFGRYCAQSIDIAGDEKLLLPASISGPFHLNTCFEEPMKTQATEGPAAPSPRDLPEFLARASRPLVIVSGLCEQDREEVLAFLLRLGAPAYLEAPSGLRERTELQRVRITNADGIFERTERNGYAIDGVLRIGSIPTHRLWRDLEDRLTEIPVFSVSQLPFSGLSRPAGVATGDVARILRAASFDPASAMRAQGLYEADRISLRKLQTLLESEPSSEAGMIHALSKLIPAGARIFLGNSLPIREWDLAADWKDRRFEVSATRGVNGIDGQISTFLGLARAGQPNWALIGDLTALYDLAAPWALTQMQDTRVDLVVINNGGGKIFDRMYPQREFQNPHELRLHGWAELWGFEYVAAREVSHEWCMPPGSGRSRLIELLPDQEATARFWKEYR